MPQSSQDEADIRAVVDGWMRATRDGDTQKVLGFIDDDAVFMVPGAEPFGKDEFRSKAGGTGEMRIDGKTEIREIRVLGDWAFARTRIDMTVTPPDGSPTRRAGYTLTLFRRGGDGRWRLARDANMLTAAQD